MGNFVYAAGPMSGLPYEQAHAWRKELANRLSPFIHVLAPTRVKPHTDIIPKVHQDRSIEGPLLTDRGITRRDKFDLRRSQVVVFNLLGVKQVYIGTTIELGWADAYEKAKVAIMEPGNIYEHAMANELFDYITGSLDEAVYVVKTLYDI